MAKNRKKSSVLTTNFGMPVANDQNSLTAGIPGPVLIQDVHLLEKLAHDAERDPRGFAIKFYTEEGNYDMVGNNM